MPYIMTKQGKKTSLLYNQSHDPVTIGTYDASLLRRLATFAAKHPKYCKQIDKRQYHDYAEYMIQKALISIRLLSSVSEEKRKEASEKAKCNDLGKIASPNAGI